MIDSDRIAAIEARYSRYDAARERYKAAIAGENGRESVLAVRELQAAEEDCRCYQAQDVSYLRAEVKRLQEAQRRERAAVEDMRLLIAVSPDTRCSTICDGDCLDCSTSASGTPRGFKWRGPQEADV